MWQKPSHGLVKVNVDASFYVDTLSGACSVVIRDERGDFLAAEIWFVPHIRDVDSAELMAIRNGIYLLANLGCNNEEIESDCSFAVETIQQMDSYLGPGVAFVSECIQLAMGFAKISFIHCFREAN